MDGGPRHPERCSSHQGPSGGEKEPRTWREEERKAPLVSRALINAAERTFLPATNFSLSEGIYTGFRCSRRRLKSRVARVQGGLRILFSLVCPRAEKRQSHSFV